MDKKIISKKNELEYLNVLRNVLNNGMERQTRNATTFSTFSEKMVFNLQEGFPIISTKRMPFKTILRELLWFISGKTSIKYLQENNVHIWDKNASKEFLESRGLEYTEGELGPVYGFQWRHIGAKYYKRKANYKNKGIDQLKYIIKTIKEDPTSRRLILTAWNPIDIDKMALPPCHMTCQFYVRGEYLDCQMYQRSGDMFLGVPFNISSYSILIHLIAHCCDLLPGKLYHILGDAHIYKDHIPAVREQLLRQPMTNYTKLILKPDTPKDIDEIKESHISLEGYSYYSAIKAEMIA